MELVEVLDYDEQWPEHFNVIKKVIWPSIAAVAKSIEHVGSTSIPGLAAKPIIDVTIVVNSDENLKLVISKLATLGFIHRGDLGIHGREAFTRLEGLPKHNLYACVEGCLPLRNHLILRDALRQSAVLRQEYRQLKLKLAEQYPDDIDAYVEGKSAFILSVLSDRGVSDHEAAEIEAVNLKPG